MKINTKIKAINEILIRKGLSKRQFSMKANIGHVTAIAICNGERNPNPNTAKKICDTLQVEFDEIFEIIPSE